MRSFSIRQLLAWTLLVVGGLSSALAIDVAAHAGLTANLAGTLKDPSGEAHNKLAIAGKVGVVIFSVPDMSLGPSQKRWSRILALESGSRLPDEVGFSLVENMAMAGAFRDRAKNEMVQQFATKKRPLLLLDEKGDVFSRFGILRDRTEILIFDRNGKVRDVEADLDDQDKVKSKIHSVVAQLMRE